MTTAQPRDQPIQRRSARPSPVTCVLVHLNAVVHTVCEWHGDQLAGEPRESHGGHPRYSGTSSLSTVARRQCEHSSWTASSHQLTCASKIASFPPRKNTVLLSSLAFGISSKNNVLADQSKCCMADFTAQHLGDPIWDALRLHFVGWYSLSRSRWK